jgi:hypothetical protein
LTSALARECSRDFFPAVGSRSIRASRPYAVSVGQRSGFRVVRGDSLALPLADKAVGRIFAGHLYGHLEEDERLVFLAESRRVANELVILDSGRPPGAKAEEWQTRGLANGTSYTVYKRHFKVGELLAEVGGEPLFSGSYYILIRSIAGENSPPRTS